MNENMEMAVVKLVKLYHKHFTLSAKKTICSSKKILIVNIYKLGDMICNVPFIREMKKNHPDAEITLLCAPEVRNYIEKIPYVNRIIYYKRPISGKHLFERQIADAYRFARQNFSEDYFDYVILPEYVALPRDIVLASFIPSDKIVMYYRDGNRIKISHTEYSCDIAEKHHAVEHGLNIIRSLGGTVYNSSLEFWTSNLDEKTADDIYLSNNLDSNAIKVAVFLSTSAKQKDWDVKNFIEVCLRLQKKYNAKIILLGAKSDTEMYGKAFEKKVSHAINLIGKTTVRQTISVMKKADFYLGGDTGTLHLAAACHLPGVVVVKDYLGAHPLYGAPMDLYYPWESNIRIVRPVKPLPGCEICCDGKAEAHCINQISAETVWQELERVIQDNVLV